MPRKGENIYKRKDGRWEGRYIKEYDTNGKAKYGYIYGKSYREVKEKKNGTPPPSLNVPQRKSTDSPVLLKEVLQTWLKACKQKNKESTYVKYHHFIYSHIIPVLGDYPIDQLNRKIIQQFVERKLESGRMDGSGGLSHKTVKDLLGVLQAAFHFFIEGSSKSILNFRGICPQEDFREIQVLEKEEQRKLETFLVKEMTVSKLGIYISLYTGLRLGEICALRWEDILLSEGIMRVRRTVQRIQNIEAEHSPKTQLLVLPPKSRCSLREIPLPEFLLQKIKPFYLKEGGYVLTSNRDKPMEPRTYQDRFQKYLRQSGIRSIHFHALRHTFATRCVEAGFEIKSLSEILGHANVNITLSRYVHSSRSLKKANMEKLDHWV